MSNHNNHTLQPGTVIEDKWIILEFLGKGGMGEVYRAHQLNLKRDVAFKIISREWLDSVLENKEELEIGLQRFQNEVLSMAQIRHPNLLQIYDYGSFSISKEPVASKFEYLVMEYIHCQSLSRSNGSSPTKRGLIHRSVVALSPPRHKPSTPSSVVILVRFDVVSYLGPKKSYWYPQRE